MASREQNEAVAGLLRQSLAKGASGEACPEPELLAAYFEHSLAEDETSRFDLHLSKCAHCRAQLAAMVRAELPRPQTKTPWLLDWRLLSATALVMVIATVLFLRRHTELAPVAQNVNSPVAAPVQVPNTDSSTTPNLERDSGSNAANAGVAGGLKKGAAPERLTPSRAKAVAQRNERKAATANTSRSSTGSATVSGSVGGAAASVQTESADIASPQPAAVGGGQGGGFAPKPSAPSEAAGAAVQQIPPSSQMVLVQPAQPSPPPKASSSQAGARAATKEQTGQPPVATSREPAEASSTAQSQTIPAAQQPSDRVINAYATNDAATQVQILEDRSHEKVIDTPIPAVKWRITTAGFVERSEDGGATWNGQEPDPEAHLIAGSAPTDKICWLVGKEGIVLVTKDATKWKKIPPPASTDITSVSAKSASDATVTTSDGRRFTTHNEGKKWKPVS